MTNKVNVKCFSDIACPWCWIGLKKFQQGAQLVKDADIDFEYRAYLLDPSANAALNKPLVEYLRDDRGFPEQKMKQMFPTVCRAAESVGVHMDMNKAVAASTMPGHRLIHYARHHGKSVEMKEELFKAYFTDGKHIATEEVLLDAAEKVGLDRAGAAAALADPKTLQGVKEDQQMARFMGVSGVPFFVINDKYAVSGAQDPAAFAEVIQKAMKESA